jgi:hypothetical protein
MAKPNKRDGFCDVCKRSVRAGEGRMMPDTDVRRGYLILCVDHAAEVSFESPRPPEVAKLPSIHQDEQKYER